MDDDSPIPAPLSLVRPKAYLLSAPRFCSRNLDSYLLARKTTWTHTETATAPEKLVEIAGRVCYDALGTRQGRNDSADYLANLLARGHGSVLEHASFTLLLTGVSRTLTHELVRHRAGFAYSQESQRYVDDSDLGFVVPEALDVESGPVLAARLAWEESLRAALACYQSLVPVLAAQATGTGRERRLYARQAARSVLPGCTASKIVVTANARAWRHFLELRGSLGAEPEIRRLTRQVLPVLVGEAPLLFGDFTIEPNGSLVTPYRKV